MNKQHSLDPFETASAPSQGANSQAQGTKRLVDWLAEAGNQDVVGFVWFDETRPDGIDLGGVRNWRLDSRGARETAISASMKMQGRSLDEACLT